MLQNSLTHSISFRQQGSYFIMQSFFREPTKDSCPMQLQTLSCLKWKTSTHTELIILNVAEVTPQTLHRHDYISCTYTATAIQM